MGSCTGIFQIILFNISIQSFAMGVCIPILCLYGVCIVTQMFKVVRLTNITPALAWSLWAHFHDDVTIKLKAQVCPSAVKMSEFKKGNIKWLNPSKHNTVKRTWNVNI